VKPTVKHGDRKWYTHTVQPADVAAFHGQVVHSVCATFSLAREVEWATRQFVLDLREDDEEGVGTFLSIEHKGPAFVGEDIVIEAWVESLEGNELICAYQASVQQRLVATGKTGQKILKRERLNRLLQKPEAK
jgi:fluoroacetyl-CoA thioesterase